MSWSEQALAIRFEGAENALQMIEKRTWSTRLATNRDKSLQIVRIDIFPPRAIIGGMPCHISYSPAPRDQRAQKPRIRVE